MAKAKPGEWSNNSLAALLGTDNVQFGKMLNGLEYPSLSMMQKFEVVFEWPVVEQVRLIPYLWEDVDLRYSMVLHEHVKDWAIANPRTVPSHMVRMHPRLASRHNKRRAQA
jgi:hypothetical protein